MDETFDADDEKDTEKDMSNDDLTVQDSLNRQFANLSGLGIKGYTVKSRKITTTDNNVKELISEYGKIDLSSNDKAFKGWLKSHHKKEHRSFSPQPVLYHELDTEMMNETAFKKWLEKKDMSNSKKTVLKKMYRKKVEMQREVEAKKLEERKRISAAKVAEWEKRKASEPPKPVTEKVVQVVEEQPKNKDKDAFNEWYQKRGHLPFEDPSTHFVAHAKDWNEENIVKSEKQEEEELASRFVSFVSVLRDSSYGKDEVNLHLQKKKKRSEEESFSIPKHQESEEYRKKYPYLVSHVDL